MDMGGVRLTIGVGTGIRRRTPIRAGTKHPFVGWPVAEDGPTQGICAQRTVTGSTEQETLWKTGRFERYDGN
jgi:hypothetical protein